ncbi:Non-specific serine/threonine protein kinase [Heracleum sosnowskyi]|uniref:non-specific serine/threonine protein kinase n=1 Tax=Heracleum sosnowskyi TaxID=360622 RepID=A0AAD8H3B0_9APIA|nr:Non-specific serine/threonine protein kinase [Heracleum sosnowskyi]
MAPLLRLFLLLLSFSPISTLDFIYNSFNATTNLQLLDDARLDSSAILFTNDSDQFSIGRLFYPSPIRIKPDTNSTHVTSFSTQFVFSVIPEIVSSPGFGLVFMLSKLTNPPGALSGQYFGVFNNDTVPTVGPIFAVEFDTGQNVEFNDPDGNHVGIDLNDVQSVKTEPGGYYEGGTSIPVNMRNGKNIHAWIEFNGDKFEINVTIAPVGMDKPVRPLLSYRDRRISNYLSRDMYVGFSASKTTWVERQRVLAWSFSDTGVARDINVTGLPVFDRDWSSSSKLSTLAIVGIVAGCVVFVGIAFGIGYWTWREFWDVEIEEDEVEDWELEYWPHRISYAELYEATDGFSKDSIIGAGGFGKVYKGVLANGTEVAVKCVNHDSKQGLREFMAEISSIGRLQHKNLVPMRGWCRKANELMLVYDYMPNGSLNTWIFDRPNKLLDWRGRRRVLGDVAEGLNYLHKGWDQLVVHRDIKSSNILLDSEMKGRLGDFGLSKLYAHGEAPHTTRVVGTLGYMAPELATSLSPTAASDVYSYGVVVLEVMTGRRPIEMRPDSDNDLLLLVDLVKYKYEERNLLAVADERIRGEYEEETMEAILKIGLACCNPKAALRPDMGQVVSLLVGEDTPALTPRRLLSELTTNVSYRPDSDADEEGDEYVIQVLSGDPSASGTS